jgi:hypothetical protein
MLKGFAGRFFLAMARLGRMYCCHGEGPARTFSTEFNPPSNTGSSADLKPEKSANVDDWLADDSCSVVRYRYDIASLPSYRDRYLIDVSVLIGNANKRVTWSSRTRLSVSIDFHHLLVC